MWSSLGRGATRSFLAIQRPDEGQEGPSSATRRVPLNGIARRVIEDCRGENDVQVFTYAGKPVAKINNTAWKKARARAGLTLRVHDLRHSFAVRLREAGVHAWTISALLGHQTRSITEHYAQPWMAELLEAVVRLCERREGRRRGQRWNGASVVPEMTSRNRRNAGQETLSS